MLRALVASDTERMVRRIFTPLALACLTLLPTSPAHASGPSVLQSTQTTADRYRPTITFTYAGAVTVSPGNATITRVSTGAVVAADVTVNNETVTLTAQGTLLSATSYKATVLPDGDATPDTITWKTRGAPAHPTLHVKVITALDPAGVDDIVRHIDRQNVMAVPRVQDLVDISTATGRAMTSTDLTGYQAAIVATDRDVLNPSAAGSQLTTFCSHGHGVVLGGQTHWSASGLWSSASAVGAPGGDWVSKWSLYPTGDPIAIQGGDMATSSVISHFLTSGLHSFHVIGYGSGAAGIQDAFSGKVLVRLQKTSAFSTFGQVMLASRQIGAGRVVDLGFRPWSNLVAGGGWDPAVSPGWALISRSLWWASDRIPPHGTHFTSKPTNPAKFATVYFVAAASDADPSGAPLSFRWKVNSGSWKRGNPSMPLYHLKAGTYTVRVQAVDNAGNLDPHIAAYTFRVLPGTIG